LLPVRGKAVRFGLCLASGFFFSTTMKSEAEIIEDTFEDLIKDDFKTFHAMLSVPLDAAGKPPDDDTKEITIESCVANFKKAVAQTRMARKLALEAIKCEPPTS
jgi:hypothetical protein